jgi:hypothetical protein
MRRTVEESTEVFHITDVVIGGPCFPYFVDDLFTELLCNLGILTEDIDTHGQSRRCLQR